MSLAVRYIWGGNESMKIMTGGMDSDHGTHTFPSLPLELPLLSLSPPRPVIKMSGEDKAKSVNIDPQWCV